VAEERRLDQVALDIRGTRMSEELYSLLSLVRVEESVHLPDAFLLRFDDPHFELFDRMTFEMGTRIDIGFVAGSEIVTVTHGEVTAIAVEQGAGGRHELVVSGMDATHRLARGPKTKSYLQMTDADIVSDVAGRYGFDTDIDATREVHDYVLQSSQSDLAFLKQRAERIGYDLWIAEGTLHFKQHPQAPGTAPALTWGENLHKFKVRFSSTERCDEVTVRAWDPSGKTAIVASADTGDPGTTASAASHLADSARSAFGRVKRFAGQFPIPTQSEADALARSLLLKASGEEVIFRAEAAGDPRIAAGALVEIKSAGEKLSGSYRITSAEHIYGSGSPYLTRFVCGGKEPGTLADLVAGNGAGSMKAGWGSLVFATVTNNDDPVGIGRVKVKFGSLTDGDESGWAKVLSPGAGPDRGVQCTPEVGDEVLVGFEHDDKRVPVVLGATWNGQDKPPTSPVEGGKVKTRSWVSRAGNSLTLDDSEGDTSVTVKAGGTGSALTLKKDKSSLEADQKLTITGAEIEIAARQKLTLKAPQIEIAGDGQVTVKGGVIKLN
jgi:phage protein D